MYNLQPETHYDPAPNAYGVHPLTEEGIKHVSSFNQQPLIGDNTGLINGTQTNAPLAQAVSESNNAFGAQIKGDLAKQASDALLKTTAGKAAASGVAKLLAFL